MGKNGFSGRNPSWFNPSSGHDRAKLCKQKSTLFPNKYQSLDLDFYHWMKKGKWFPPWLRPNSHKHTVTCCTNNVGQTGQAGQTGQTKLTFKLEFPGNLCLAAFAILVMFYHGTDMDHTNSVFQKWRRSCKNSRVGTRRSKRWTKHKTSFS